MTEPPVSQRVAVADRFPVVATGPDGAEYQIARVIVTRPSGDWPGWAWVWRDHRPAPTLLWSGPWSGTDLHRVSGFWTLDTPNGSWRFVKARGCGCGSPLKRLVPWTPMRRGLL